MKEKLKSRKFWVIIGAALGSVFYPPAAPLLLKLAMIYVPSQAIVDVADKVAAAKAAVNDLRGAVRSAG